MITRKLWRVLNDPPTLHPLFWRTIYGTGATQFASRNYKLEEYVEKASIIYLAVLITVWILTNVSRGGWQIGFLNLLFLVLSLPIILLAAWLLRYTLLNGMVNGLLWALRISNRMAHERENGRFELLWLSPPGALGATVALCTACLYRKATLHQFRMQSKIILNTVVLVGLLAVIAARSGNATPYVSYKLLTLIHVIALVTALRLDSIHSPIIGSLVGMLMPTYTYHRLDAHLWTAGVYLLLQLATLVLTLGTALVLLPGVYASLHLAGWYADISPPLLSLGVFYGSREAVISLLWHLLARQLNADPDEMKFWP